MKDEDAYVKFPHHWKWFNKLYVANLFGYKCGPAGVSIPEDGTYVVRPVMNLQGMGAGAKVMSLKEGEHFDEIPPGHFWCEYLTGHHYSADYKWEHCNITGGKWVGIQCYRGINFPYNLTKFTEWHKEEYIPELTHPEFKELKDVGHINVEFKGNQPIEVHLRPSGDPKYDHIIPVWQSDNQHRIEHYKMSGYEFVPDFDDAGKLLDDPRLGFLVK